MVSPLSHSDRVVEVTEAASHSRAPMTPATAASRPPALMASSAAELADELSLVLVALLGPVKTAVLESSVAVAVDEPVEAVLAALPVAEAVLVDAYWLARAQNWVTWPWALAARESLGQLL